MAPVHLFVSGIASGAGKSTICLGLLHLLSSTYSAQELAYIKPATQCTDLQLVAKYCANRGIACQSVGPIVYRKGFTTSVLSGEDGRTSEQLLREVHEAVGRIGVDKKVVLVDGVGYPSVGSVIGVSNAHMAAMLDAVLILVGKPGVGDAIDSFHLAQAYFKQHHVAVQGVLFNKLRQDENARHAFDASVKTVSEYMQANHPEIRLLGFLPILEELNTTFYSSSLTLEEQDIAATAAITSLVDTRVDVSNLLSMVVSQK